MNCETVWYFKDFALSVRGGIYFTDQLKYFEKFFIIKLVMKKTAHLQNLVRLLLVFSSKPGPNRSNRHLIEKITSTLDFLDFHKEIMKNLTK